MPCFCVCILNFCCEVYFYVSVYSVDGDEPSVLCLWYHSLFERTFMNWFVLVPEWWGAGATGHRPQHTIRCHVCKWFLKSGYLCDENQTIVVIVFVCFHWSFILYKLFHDSIQRAQRRVVLEYFYLLSRALLHASAWCLSSLLRCLI